MPPAIAAVYLDFDWDREAVWALDIATTRIPREQLDWHLDLPFWSSVRGEARFDVRPREVLDTPNRWPRHTERIDRCDLACPLDVMHHRGRVCVMDGLHRLACMFREHRRTASVRFVPRSRVRATSP